MHIKHNLNFVKNFLIFHVARYSYITKGHTRVLTVVFSEYFFFSMFFCFHKYSAMSTYCLHNCKMFSIYTHTCTHTHILPLLALSGTSVRLCYPLPALRTLEKLDESLTTSWTLPGMQDRCLVEGRIVKRLPCAQQPQYLTTQGIVSLVSPPEKSSA
jgi:hypothetical protein